MPFTESPRRVHLAAHFPGVNSTTVWSDPESGSQVEFESFAHLAATAERGVFDFLFLAEGLRLREHRGQIFDLDVVGRPDTLSVLTALAAVTERIGLAGTLNTTFHEPYELVRQLATLDHLSRGRAAWNVVTTHNAFTGENFRRGGFLDAADRYARAEDFIHAARLLWGSWPEPFQHSSRFFQIEGRFPLPAPPQGHPVVFQAGDSDQGREFAAGSADVIFSRHSGIEEAKAFYADVKRRLAAYGRAEDELKIFPAVTYVLGDTPAEATERSAHIQRQQISGPGAIAFLEQVWGRDLSAYDPDGQLPDVEPDVDNLSITRGRVRHIKDPREVVGQWRELARNEQLSIRELVIRVSARHSFVGTPAAVASEIDRYVQERAVDGFILVPHLTPAGLDEFVAKVVPLLQERGVYPEGYQDITLRGNLGLGPARSAETWAAGRDAARSGGPQTADTVAPRKGRAGRKEAS